MTGEEFMSSGPCILKPQIAFLASSGGQFLFSEVLEKMGLKGMTSLCQVDTSKWKIGVAFVYLPTYKVSFYPSWI